MSQIRKNSCCCIANCINSSGKIRNNIVLFSFPKSKELSKQWLHFVNSNGSDIQDIYTSHRVCQYHFPADSFSNYGQYEMGLAQILYLKKGTIPSLMTNSKVSDQDDFPAKRPHQANPTDSSCVIMMTRQPANNLASKCNGKGPPPITFPAKVYVMKKGSSSVPPSLKAPGIELSYQQNTTKKQYLMPTTRDLAPKTPDIVLRSQDSLPKSQPAAVSSQKSLQMLALRSQTSNSGGSVLSQSEHEPGDLPFSRSGASSSKCATSRSRVCAMLGCSSTASRSYHRFPRDPALAQRWLELCCRADYVNTRTAVVCERHFSQGQKGRQLKYELLGWDRRPANLRILSRAAVPDINLPVKEDAVTAAAGETNCDQSDCKSPEMDFVMPECEVTIKEEGGGHSGSVPSMPGEVTKSAPPGSDPSRRRVSCAPVGEFVTVKLEPPDLNDADSRNRKDLSTVSHKFSNEMEADESSEDLPTDEGTRDSSAAQDNEEVLMDVIGTKQDHDPRGWTHEEEGGLASGRVGVAGGFSLRSGKRKKEDEESDEEISQSMRRCDALHDVTDESEVEEERAPCKRKKFTSINQFVNAMDACINEENLDLVKNPSPGKRFMMVLEEAAETKEERIIQWSSKVCRMKHLAKSTPKPQLVLPNETCASTPYDAWSVFFTPKIISMLVKYTNEKIKCKVAGHRGTQPGKERFQHYALTDATEMIAFLGLCYARALLGLNRVNENFLFKDCFGHPLFGACMTCKRFMILQRYLSFDDRETRHQRYVHDRLAETREVFEIFNDQCSSFMNVRDFLCLEDSLYCHRSPRNSALAYDQPVKYGMLFKSLRCARYPYTFRSAVYTGCPAGAPGPYYFQDQTELVKSLVDQLANHTDLEGKAISMNGQHTNIQLFEWLKSKQVMAFGPIFPGRRGIPSQIASLNDRKINSYQVFQELPNRNITLHSYVTDSNITGPRNLLILSSYPAPIGTTSSAEDKKSKPAIVKLYEQTKRKMNIVDEDRLILYSTHSRSLNRSHTPLAYMLDTARVNAQTLHRLKRSVDPARTSEFEFGWELAHALVAPYVQKRKNRKNLSKMTLAKIHVITGSVAFSQLDGDVRGVSSSLPDGEVKAIASFPPGGPVAAVASSPPDGDVTSAGWCQLCNGDSSDIPNRSGIIKGLSVGCSKCDRCGKAICGARGRRYCRSCHQK